MVKFCNITHIGTRTHMLAHAHARMHTVLCTQSFIHLLVVWSTNSTLPTVCMHIYLRIVLCNSEFDHSSSIQKLLSVAENEKQIITTTTKCLSNWSLVKNPGKWPVLSLVQLHHWFYHWLFETMFCSADTSDHRYIYIYLHVCMQACACASMCVHVPMCVMLQNLSQIRSPHLPSNTFICSYWLEKSLEEQSLQKPWHRTCQQSSFPLLIKIKMSALTFGAVNWFVAYKVQ